MNSVPAAQVVLAAEVGHEVIKCSLLWKALLKAFRGDHSATNAEHPASSAELQGFADYGRAKPAEAGAPERRLQPALDKERGQVLNGYLPAKLLKQLQRSSPDIS